MEGDRDNYYLEQVTITEGSEDGYQYEEIPPDDDLSLPDGDEDLLRAVQTIEEQAEDLQSQRSPVSSQRAASHRPEVVDDFLRNFLIKMGMMKTLECFQTEWYEMMQKGLLQPEAAGFVPDLYSHNQMLDEEIKSLRKEVETYKLAARMKVHYASYEPLLRQLHEKYQTVLRQKMLTSLERDRAVGEVTGLQATLKNLESGHKIELPVKKGSACEHI
uniref:Sperm-associated antigen 16 protein n=1 Tax=Pyxicephalus adspersus TaxID=30357 RepID=A0AAV3AA11_PYXAD|nr:TPA: hypothetical protein GDO54_015715 [Pyxicephalus adspersus]